MDEPRRVASVTEPKWQESCDQASALRQLAQSGQPEADGPGGRIGRLLAEPSAEVLVLSPFLADRARAVKAMLPVRVRARAVCGVGPGPWAERAVRGARTVLVVMGNEPQETSAGFGLLRWAAGRRIDAGIAAVLMLADPDEPRSIGLRRRLRAAIVTHIGRTDIGITQIGDGRATRRDRRSIARAMRAPGLVWHPDCGGVA